MGYVDAWINMPTRAGERLVNNEHDPLSSNVRKWFHTQNEARKTGDSVSDVIAMMDKAGVDKVLVSARHSWDHPATRPRGVFETTYGMPDDIFDMFAAEMAKHVAENKGRVYGSVLIDPWGAMQAVRQLERAVKEYGMVAARLFPAGQGIPLNHPLCYPVYAKCIELDIPITANIGFPGPMRSALLQQPILLDEVLLSFPELKLVGTHVGHPWHNDTVALLRKHPNFSLMTSGWAPKHVPQEIMHHLNTRGSRQVMWASDYPLLSIQRAVDEAEALEYRSDEIKQRYTRDNCLELFKLG
jgi:uncharacterized protein